MFLATLNLSICLSVGPPLWFGLKHLNNYWMDWSWSTEDDVRWIKHILIISIRVFDRKNSVRGLGDLVGSIDFACSAIITSKTKDISLSSTLCLVLISKG